MHCGSRFRSPYDGGGRGWQGFVEQEISSRFPGYHNDDNMIELIQQFRAFKPYLKKRLEAITKSGKTLQFRDDISDINYYLEALDDVMKNVGNYKPDQIRGFIDKIHEMIRKNPLTELPHQRRSLDLDVEEFGDNDRPRSPSPGAMDSSTGSESGTSQIPLISTHKSHRLVDVNLPSGDNSITNDVDEWGTQDTLPFTRRETYKGDVDMRFGIYSGGGRGQPRPDTGVGRGCGRGISVGRGAGSHRDEYHRQDFDSRLHGRDGYSRNDAYFVDRSGTNPPPPQTERRLPDWMKDPAPNGPPPPSPIPGNERHRHNDVGESNWEGNNAYDGPTHDSHWEEDWRNRSRSESRERYQMKLNQHFERRPSSESRGNEGARDFPPSHSRGDLSSPPLPRHGHRDYPGAHPPPASNIYSPSKPNRYPMSLPPRSGYHGQHSHPPHHPPYAGNPTRGGLLPTPPSYQQPLLSGAPRPLGGRMPRPMGFQHPPSNAYGRHHDIPPPPSRGYHIPPPQMPQINVNIPVRPPTSDHYHPPHPPHGYNQSPAEPSVDSVRQISSRLAKHCFTIRRSATSTSTQNQVTSPGPTSPSDADTSNQTLDPRLNRLSRPSTSDANQNRQQSPPSTSAVRRPGSSDAGNVLRISSSDPVAKNRIDQERKRLEEAKERFRQQEAAKPVNKTSKIQELRKKFEKEVFHPLGRPNSKKQVGSFEDALASCDHEPDPSTSKEKSKSSSPTRTREKDGPRSQSDKTETEKSQDITPEKSKSKEKTSAKSTGIDKHHSKESPGDKISRKKSDKNEKHEKQKSRNTTSAKPSSSESSHSSSKCGVTPEKPSTSQVSKLSGFKIPRKPKPKEPEVISIPENNPPPPPPPPSAEDSERDAPIVSTSPPASPEPALTQVTDSDSKADESEATSSKAKPKSSSGSSSEVDPAALNYLKQFLMTSIDAADQDFISNEGNLLEIFRKIKSEINAAKGKPNEDGTSGGQTASEDNENEAENEKSSAPEGPQERGRSRERKRNTKRRSSLEKLHAALREMGFDAKALGPRRCTRGKQDESETTESEPADPIVPEDRPITPPPSSSASQKSDEVSEVESPPKAPQRKRGRPPKDSPKGKKTNKKKAVVAVAAADALEDDGINIASEVPEPVEPPAPPPRRGRKRKLKTTKANARKRGKKTGPVTRAQKRAQEESTKPKDTPPTTARKRKPTTTTMILRRLTRKRQGANDTLVNTALGKIKVDPSAHNLKTEMAHAIKAELAERDPFLDASHSYRHETDNITEESNVASQLVDLIDDLDHDTVASMDKQTVENMDLDVFNTLDSEDHANSDVFVKDELNISMDDEAASDISFELIMNKSGNSPKKSSRRSGLGLDTDLSSSHENIISESSAISATAVENGSSAASTLSSTERNGGKQSTLPTTTLSMNDNSANDTLDESVELNKSALSAEDCESTREEASSSATTEEREPLREHRVPSRGAFSVISEETSTGVFNPTFSDGNNSNDTLLSKTPPADSTKEKESEDVEDSHSTVVDDSSSSETSSSSFSLLSISSGSNSARKRAFRFELTPSVKSEPAIEIRIESEVQTTQQPESEAQIQAESEAQTQPENEVGKEPEPRIVVPEPETQVKTVPVPETRVKTNTEISMTEVKTETETSIGEVKTEVETSMAEVKTEAADFEEVRKDVFKCELCNFSGKKIVSHYVNKHYPCTIPQARLMPETFEGLIELNSSESLQLLEIILDESQTQVWPCLYCDDRYDCIVDFYDHLTSHTGEFRYECGECKTSYPYQKSLTNHVKQHKGVAKSCVRYAYDLNINKGSRDLSGFLCNDCYYFQLRFESIIQHIEKSGHSALDVKSVRLIRPVGSGTTTAAVGSRNTEVPNTNAKVPNYELKSVKEDIPEDEENTENIEPLANMEVDEEDKNEEKASIFFGTEVNFSPPSVTLNECTVSIPRVFEDTFLDSLLKRVAEEPKEGEESNQEDNPEVEGAATSSESRKRKRSEDEDRVEEEAPGGEGTSATIANNNTTTSEPSTLEDAPRKGPNLRTTRTSHGIKTVKLDYDACVEEPNDFFLSSDDSSEESDWSDESEEVDTEVKDEPKDEMKLQPEIKPEQVDVYEIPDLIRNNEHLIRTRGGRKEDVHDLRLISDRKLVKVRRAGDCHAPNTVLFGYIKPNPQRSPHKLRDTREVEKLSTSYGRRIHPVKHLSCFKEMLTVQKLTHFFKCMGTFCSFTTDNIEEFLNHLDENHFRDMAEDCVRFIPAEDVRDYKDAECCPYCSARYRDPEDLIDHMVNQHGQSGFQCNRCFYRSFYHRYVVRHFDMEHPNENTQVLKCPKRTDVESQEATLFQIFVYKCDIENPSCDKTRRFVFREDFLDHLKQCVPMRELYPCHLCKAGVPMSELIEHYKSHNLFKFHCSYCQFGSEVKSDLDEHFVQVHPNTSGRVFYRVKPTSSNPAVGNVVGPPEELAAKASASANREVSNVAVENLDSTSQNAMLEREAAGNEGSGLDVSENEESEKGRVSNLKGIDLYRCVTGGCCFSAQDSETFKDHVNSCKFVAESRSLSCAHCERKLKTVTNLLEHLKVHGEKKQVCSLCSFRGWTSTEITKHFKTVHRVASYKLIRNEPTQSEPDPDIVAFPKDVAAKSTCSVETFENNYYTFARRAVYSFENIHKLPQSKVFGSDLFCAMCPYSTKVRSNIIRHLSIHKQALEDGKTVVPQAPRINPVPYLSREDMEFDKMMNLAASSHKTDGASATADVVRKLPQFVKEQFRYVCSVCDHMTSDDALLRTHITVIHRGVDVYKCPHCYQQPESRENPDNTVPLDKISHHLRLHGPKLYKCGHCMVVHHQLRLMEKHIPEKHPEKKPIHYLIRDVDPDGIPSSRPTTSGMSRRQSAEDAKLAPTEKWKCYLCSSKTVFGSWLETKSHCETMHKVSSQFKCLECDFTSDDVTETLTHCKDNCKSERKNQIMVMFSKLENFDAEDTSVTLPVWKRHGGAVRHIHGNFTEDSVALIKQYNSQGSASDPVGPVASSPLRGSPALQFSNKTTLKPTTSSGAKPRRSVGGTPAPKPGAAKTALTFSVPPSPPKQEVFKYRCHKCDMYKTKNPNELRVHLFNEFRYKRWKCLICQTTFTTEKSLKGHIERDHQKLYQQEFFELQPENFEIEAEINECIEKQHRKKELILSFAVEKLGKLACKECKEDGLTFDTFESHILQKHSE